VEVDLDGDGQRYDRSVAIRLAKYMWGPALALILAACGTSSSTSYSLVGSFSLGNSRLSGDKAAQADLETALRTAMAQHRQLHNFSQAGPPELQQFNSSVAWVEPDADLVPTGRQVGVSNGGDNANQTVTLAAVSTTGTCWYLVDVASSNSETLTADLGIRTAGVWYGRRDHAATTCNAPDNGPPPASSLSGAWSKKGFSRSKNTKAK
jgi:hypothetical protein